MYSVIVMSKACAWVIIFRLTSALIFIVIVVRSLVGIFGGRPVFFFILPLYTHLPCIDLTAPYKRS